MGRVEVVDDPERRRYVALVDGDEAGFVQYHARPGLVAFVHTEIDERYSGAGVGSALVRGALAGARAQGVAVLPFCPFVNGWLQRHPEETDLVPAEHRARFGLGPAPAG